MQTKIHTVAELAAMLQGMVESGNGDLPVFTSDGRARYPFGMVTPYTLSGYPECLLVQPQPHLHAEPRELRNRGATFFEEVNAEADRIRSTCGAFA